MRLLNVKFIEDSIKEEFKNFIKRKQLKDNIKASTVTSYDISSRKFFKYLYDNNLTINDLNDEVTLGYTEYLLSQYKRSTVNTRIKDIKAFLDYLAKKDMLSESDYEELTKVNTPNKTKSALNVKQRERLIKAVRDSNVSTEKRIRNLAIIHLGIYTGLRVSEIASLKVSNINFENKVLSVYRKKTDTYDDLPIADECIKYIKMNIDINNLNNDDSLFVSNSKKKAMTVSSIQKMYSKNSKKCFVNTDLHGIHALRRTFATQLSKNGVDIYRISRFMGHSNVKTTENYIDIKNNTTKADYNVVNNLF